MADEAEHDEAEIERMLRNAKTVHRAAERARRESRTKDNVVACRLDDQALGELDTFVEAGVRTTRADAAGWLIGVGLEANQPLLNQLRHTVAEIRRLRKDAASKAEHFVRPDDEGQAPDQVDAEST